MTIEDQNIEILRIFGVPKVCTATIIGESARPTQMGPTMLEKWMNNMKNAHLKQEMRI